ncbi:MAG: hypothetical protein DWQ04_25455 [Chloroflexi bacterium]|nr:MAG: hypothetical protein DWQ04_25455 [Chloroflexota bacterium]
MKTRLLKNPDFSDAGLGRPWRFWYTAGEMVWGYLEKAQKSLEVNSSGGGGGFRPQPIRNAIRIGS